MDITDVEFTRFIDFLIEKTKDSVEPLTMASIVFKEFSQLEGDQIPTGYGPYSRFHFKIAPVIDKFHNYSIETRIRLMFALGAKVSPEFLALTREHGIAQLDGRNRICKYESEDGTLQLGTAHSESAKRCSASDSDQGGAKIAKITEEPQITQHPTKSEENYE